MDSLIRDRRLDEARRLSLTYRFIDDFLCWGGPPPAEDLYQMRYQCTSNGPQDVTFLGMRLRIESHPENSRRRWLRLSVHDKEEQWPWKPVRYIHAWSVAPRHQTGGICKGLMISYAKQSIWRISDKQFSMRFTAFWTGSTRSTISGRVSMPSSASDGASFRMCAVGCVGSSNTACAPTGKAGLWGNLLRRPHHGATTQVYFLPQSLLLRLQLVLRNGASPWIQTLWTWWILSRVLSAILHHPRWPTSAELLDGVSIQLMEPCQGISASC